MTHLLIGLYFLALAGASTFLVVLAVMTYREGNKKKGVMIVVGLVAMLSVGYLLMSSNPIPIGSTVGDMDYSDKEAVNSPISEEFLKKDMNRKQCELLESGEYTPNLDTPSGKYWDRLCGQLEELNLPDRTPEEIAQVEIDKAQASFDFDERHCKKIKEGKSERYNEEKEFREFWDGECIEHENLKKKGKTVRATDSAE